MRYATLAGVLCALLAQPLISVQAAAEGISDDIVRIGVLTDMSGLYSYYGGEGSVTATKMAVEDFGGKVLGKRIEVVAADHQNKADIAASKAREWFDAQKVDMITNLTNSAVALAVVEVAKVKNRVVLLTGPGSTRLTNDACSPVSVHYVFDTSALAHGTGSAVVKHGGDSWFFLTADYAFGLSLERETSDVVKANGGKVLGAVRHPLNAPDMSSFLLTAQRSGSKIIGLANASGDMINSVKGAMDFGITKSGKQSIAPLIIFINDVHGLGLETAQGMLLTTGFYWDLNDATRTWAKRFYEKMKVMPDMIQAGDYSATLHYLKAIEAAGTDEAAAVMRKMRELPVNDFFAQNGRIREDGRMVHDMYFAQVKKPSESKYPWDYYQIKAIIPGDEAFQPMSKSTCPFVKK